MPLHIAPSCSITGAIPILPLHAFMVRVGKTLTLHFACTGIQT